MALFEKLMPAEIIPYVGTKRIRIILVPKQGATGKCVAVIDFQMCVLSQNHYAAGRIYNN